MKRVVSSSIITLFIFIAAAAAFLYFKNYRNKGGDPVKAIPIDVAFIFVYNHDSDVAIKLESLEYWPLLNKVQPFAELKKQLSFLDSSRQSNNSFSIFMRGQPLLITSHVTGAGKFDFIFIKSLDNGFNESATEELLQEVSATTNVITTRNYDGNSIREVTFNDGRIFTYVISKGLFIASYTPFLVEDALRQMKLGKPVISNNDLIGRINSSESALMLVNFTNLPSFAGVFMNSDALQGIPTLNDYGKWVLASIEPSKNKIQFAGNILETDSTNFIRCFDGQGPVEKKLLQILPRKTAIINYYGTDEMQIFYQNLNNRYFSLDAKSKKRTLLNTISTNYKVQVESKMLQWIDQEFALVVTEPAGVHYDNNCFAVFHARDIKLAKKSLNSMSRMIDQKTGKSNMEEKYNGHSIGYVRLTGVLQALFGDIFQKVSKMYYTDIGEYIIFGNQPAAIRTFIDEYNSGLLLTKTDYFTNVLSTLPEKGNHFFYIKPALAFQVFKSVANPAWRKNIDEYKEVIAGISGIGFQYNNDNGDNNIEGVMNFSDKQNPEGVDQIFAIDADSSISVKPLLTTDPLTTTRQLVFHDDGGNIYMADNNGNQVWKQPIDGKIMSEVFEIDLFKNNTRQFLFNTAEYLYLLDTKGSPVGNYPIRLPAKATNGLVVFDFDKNREFKIYIACENKRIYAYLPSGKPLPGWNFQSKLDVVTSPLKWISMNGKEDLFINDRSGKIAIVNRYGEQALTFKNDLFIGINSGLYKTQESNLIFTDSTGNIIKVSQDGNHEIIPLNSFSSQHGFLFADIDDDGESEYLFVDGNAVTVYNMQLALLFRKEFESSLDGVVQLFKLNKGKAIAVRSSASDKTWLLKPDGSVYSGFPVRGSTDAVIDELNLDGNKNLVLGAKDGQLFVYSIE